LQNHASARMVLMVNASGRENESVPNGALLDCSWKKDAKDWWREVVRSNVLEQCASIGGPTPDLVFVFF